MNGYQEALTIEKLINKLLDDNPITKDNYLDWMKFSRTLSTAANIIFETAKDEMSGI